jgi:hypothetical protein
MSNRIKNRGNLYSPGAIDAHRRSESCIHFILCHSTEYIIITKMLYYILQDINLTVGNEPATLDFIAYTTIEFNCE